MSEKYAKLIVKWLISCETIQDKEFDLYVYAVQCFFILLAPLGLALAIGIMLKRTVSAVAIILPFMLIRKFSGGYHAKREWVCLTSSSFILGGCIFASEYITYSYGLTSVMLMAAVLLILNSPVESENRRLDEQERHAYKKVTIVLVVLSVLISFVCYECGLENMAANLAIGIILTGALQIPCLWGGGE